MSSLPAFFSRDEALSISARLDGEGGKDRVTMLPQALKEPLSLRLSRVEALHEQDLKERFGTVYLPSAPLH